MSFNGWTNEETYIVATELGREFFNDLQESAPEFARDTPRTVAVERMRQQIDQWLHYECPYELLQEVAELVMRKVDLDEIAQAYLDQFAPEEKPEA